MIHVLLHALVPGTRPTPFLHIVGDCFAASAATAVMLTFLIRTTWRRGKQMGDL